MTMKTIRTSFVFAIIILLLCFSANVFAIPVSATISNSPQVNSIQINDNHVTITGPNTATFKYTLFDTSGADITSKVPVSDISIDAIVGWNPLDGSGGRAEASLDSLTGTCTLKYDFSSSDKSVRITLTYNKLYNEFPVADSQSLSIGEDPYDTEIYEIKFPSDYLTSTGTNTATFQYKLSNGINDITKNVPASQLSAFASIDSTVTLDPSTGTGTIIFNSTDTDKPIKVTLTDKLTGITAILNTTGLSKDPIEKVAASEVSRINFVSSDLIKTGANTATFNYKILDHRYLDVTDKIPAADINATAFVGSSKAEISLDPSTETGTITYNFSDTDKEAMISLIYKTGVEASAALNITSSDSENNADNNNDLEIAKIIFPSTDIIGGSWLPWSELKYELLNKYGKDITRKIPASQIEVSSSINSIMTLVPKDGVSRIIYNYSYSDGTIIVSLSDKLTGVKAALNIGNAPSTSDIATDTTTPSATEVTTDNSNQSIPTGVSVATVTKNMISIQWNPVVGVDYYNVYYSTDNVNYKPVQDSDGNAINFRWQPDFSFEFMQVPDNTTIYFKVVSVSNGMQSRFSNVVKATTSVPKNINPWQEVSKVKITSTQINCSSDGKVGYINCTVADNNGYDITNSNYDMISVTSSIGSATYKNGIITIAFPDGVDIKSIGSVKIEVRGETAKYDWLGYGYDAASLPIVSQGSIMNFTPINP